MKAKISSVGVIAAIVITAALLPASAGASSPNAGTSVAVTDVLSGAPLVGKNFVTDLDISVTSSVTDTIGVLGVELWVSFDPAIVGVYDFDGNPSNGTQVEIKNGFFDGNLVVVANEVFTGTPTIPHPTECDTQGCIHVAASHTGGSGEVTDGSGPVATITWVGLATGSAGIGIPVIGTGEPPGSVLANASGEPVPIDEISTPNIAVTLPGTLAGTVERQGTHTDNTGSKITVMEVNGGMVATTTTITNGTFSLDVPIGGTYNVDASYPGYLHAQKSAVHVVGTTVDVGATALVGGDVNDDNCINILDIVSIVAQFGQSGLPASNAQDINDDGTVNIFDLTISAGNFGRCGPTAWAQ